VPLCALSMQVSMQKYSRNVRCLSEIVGKWRGLVAQVGVWSIYRQRYSRHRCARAKVVTLKSTEIGLSKGTDYGIG
jgi:hypothetical protein